MLLLVTIGLVLVGAVALVIGFVSNSLGPIYLSIACSVIAGIVLVLFSRMARRQESSGAAPSVPSRPSSWGPPPAAPEPPSSLATRVDIPATPPPPPPVSRPEPPRYEREPEPTFDFAPEREPVGATAGFARAPEPEPMPEDEDFPIPRYDMLRASQILERLPDLSLEELDMVREREEQGKNRATIIRRVDLRIDELEAAQDEAAASAMDEEPELDLAAEPEPMEAPAAASPVGAPMDDGFPIEDYDALSSDEIIAMLDDLDDDELDMVAAREERGRNRVEILEYIDDMFEEVPVDDTGAAAAAAPAPAPVVTPPARPVAKKATAKKAPAKKAAAAAGAPRKAAAKKAPPVAKAPLAKAPAAKVTAAKVPAAGRGAKKAATAAPVAAPAPAPAAKVPAAGRGAKKAAKAAPAAPTTPASVKKAAKKAAAAKKRPL